MGFQKAIKRDAKLRLAVSGPAGAGKTFTLLRLGTELARGTGGRVALVDTEHGSASKYAHTPACTADCSDPSHFDFDVIEPSKFDPRDLMKDIDSAIDGGYSVVVVDSLSHYWMGPDGELEMVDNAAKQSRSGNSFAAWKTVTPIHNLLVDTMLRAPIHILVSMRTKTEWVVEKDEKTGKNTPRKIGLQPVMRDGIEFEFDVCGDIDQDNTLTVTKTRCSSLTGKSINRPGKDMAELLKIWLGSPAAQETRGDGSTQGVAQSPPVTPTPASTEATPTTAEIPQEPAVPVPLRLIFQELQKPGKSREAMLLMKEKLQTVMPANGAEEYARICAKNGLKRGEGMKITSVKAALLEMWACSEFAEEHKSDYVATDADLPAGLFDTSKEASYAND